ncbi:MAG TPA: UDP-N-acetylmuramoyl-tripeptide--D-alanyl-D-alanine ligase [Acidobacteriota bacterium]|nr:UDP-N-acetylmuramoyl-tripeptide--D-alanyl-D-alanine ligase [Acidobacteriota bacterium]
MASELTAAEVEAGTGGTLVFGSRDTVFANVSIDTRSLQRGDIFFAIRGPNQDGHRFIPDALSKGALGAVVERSYEYPGKFPAVLVKVVDTHKALKDLAMLVRRRWPGTLVAITGSMGKTTTRTFVAQVLQSSFNVYQTPGNYNNLFGLPLALFGLRLQHDFGIFEMGMSAPGEIAEMCRIAEPTIGILTNIAPAHLAFFDSLEEIAQAKSELAQALPPDGTLIYNADDLLVREISAKFAGRKISFGFSDLADIRAASVEITGPDQTRFDLIFAGITRKAAIPFAGAHYVMNALPAVALGHRFSIPAEQMVDSLGKLQQASMRGRLLRFADGFAVIDDSYNSNPQALMQMIEVLSAIPSYKRRILVAGEMLELGKESGAMHSECGTYAAAQGLDMVIGIQGAAREIVRAAVESGVPEAQARFFDNADAAADFVATILHKGDLVLVKGSRGVRVEKIVQSLRSSFELLN